MTGGQWTSVNGPVPFMKVIGCKPIKTLPQPLCEDWLTVFISGTSSLPQALCASLIIFLFLSVSLRIENHHYTAILCLYCVHVYPVSSYKPLLCVYMPFHYVYSCCPAHFKSNSIWFAARITMKECVVVPAVL